MAESAPQTRAELEKIVKQQILLSIGLKFEEKDELMKKIPSLNETQLSQLKKVFDDESQRKEQMLNEFFAKNPELFPEYEHFAQKHISSIYHGVEMEEKATEERRSQELLTMNF